MTITAILIFCVTLPQFQLAAGKVCEIDAVNLRPDGPEALKLPESLRCKSHSLDA